jgi:hypothetical protein
MSHICSTRALKNIKAIRSGHPRALPIVEPLKGYASGVPFDVLQRFHQMTDEELRPYPQLIESAHALRRKALQEAATVVLRKPPTSAPTAQGTPTTWGDNPGPAARRQRPASSTHRFFMGR